jgi:hypothetical protein
LTSAGVINPPHKEIYMFIRTGFVTNSSSSNFVIVSKDKSVTEAFLERVGFKEFVHEFYKGPVFKATMKEMVEVMQPNPNPDYAPKICSDDIEEIINTLKEVIPEAVRYKDPEDPRHEFYDPYGWVSDDEVDTYETYRALQKMGYVISKYGSDDSCRGIHAAMDVISNGEFVSWDTKEFIVKTSHH